MKSHIALIKGDLVEANQVIAVLQGIDRKNADLRDALAEVRLRQVELAKVIFLMKFSRFKMH